MLASFDGSNGAGPAASLIMDGGGNLYGTTEAGGATTDGTVFELARGSSSITMLALFNGSDGSLPIAGLIMDGAGNLYGTTFYGGAGPGFGNGTIFELNRLANTESETVTQATPTLTTTPGGTVSLGSGAKLTDLANLSGGFNPTGTITFTLYAPDNVTIVDSETATVDGNGSYFTPTGYAPTAIGTYRWVVSYSGDDNNALITPYSVTTLVSFNFSNGANPFGGVIRDTKGNLYGTTQAGGASGDGTVFELDHGSSTITTLASFNGTNGANPQAGVIRDGAGNLYGTTDGGGAFGDGTVFELAHGSSAITTLASFSSSDGGNPTGGLIMDASGNLFGTTFGGEGAGDGTVFELAHGSRTVTTLASFNGTNGASPFGGVIMDGAGNLFGTTEGGGDFGDGTVFELAHGTSTITALASFNGSNGWLPIAGVIIDGAGNLFGTTVRGGASDNGTLFELAHGSNTITTIASFNGNNGARPVGGVMMDVAGNLYGTTQEGGAIGAGTVFELVHGSGTITTLAFFNGSNGARPLAGVIMDDAGNLYGTTDFGGASGAGTVFELDRVDNTELETVIPAMLTISGSTFDDANGDGILETGEVGFPGVTVSLYQETDGQPGLQTGTGGDTLVGTQISGAGGAYQFTGLGTGTYYVFELVPTGFVSTTANPVTVSGVAGADVSNVNLGDARLNAKAMLGAVGIGTWKNHTSIITARDLAYLSTLYLRNPDGSRFVFPYTNFTSLTSTELGADQRAFSNFLGNANSRNSANMLSAQLAVLVLNVRWGSSPAFGDRNLTGLSASAVIYDPNLAAYIGSLDSAFTGSTGPGGVGGGVGGTDFLYNGGLIMVRDIIIAADNELYLHPYSVGGGVDRNFEIELETAIANANQDLDFIS
jgi:uncharacterized repeat protein (TIGR03803 family)